MKISNFKIALKYFLGGIDDVAEYVLNAGSEALKSLDASSKEKIQAVLNLFLKISNVLTALSFLVPTKWQSAWKETIEAVNFTISSLQDFTLTVDELDKIIQDFQDAINAWKSPDDQSCVEP